MKQEYDWDKELENTEEAAQNTFEKKWLLRFIKVVLFIFFINLLVALKYQL